MCALNPLSLGLDIGTTTITAVAFDAAADRVVSKATRLNDAGAVAGEHNQAELKLDRALDIAIAALAEVTQSLGAQARAVRSVGVTGQMHGAAFLGQDLRPVRTAITWQDQRSRDLLPEIIERAGGAGAFASMGCLPAAGYLGATLFWLHRQAALPDAHVCCIPTAVAAMLTGRPPVSDVTLAASSGFFDVVRRCWPLHLFADLGLPTHILPPVVELEGERAGRLRAELADRLGLPRDLVVGVALGDHQASLIGSCCEALGSAHVNVGTGGQVSMVIERFAPADAAHGIETRPFLNGRFVLTGATLCGGDALALLRRFFLEVMAMFGRQAAGADEGSDAAFQAMLSAAAQTPPGADGVRVRPTFDGARHRPEMCAAISGLRRDNFTPAHVTRALVEGIADELGGFYDAMRALACSGRDAPPAPGALVGSGNALRRNALLREAIARRFSLPVRAPAWEEEAAVGAAIVAARLTP